MTKFQKCVMVWIVEFAFLFCMLLAMLGSGSNNKATDGLIIMGFISLGITLVVFIVMASRKPRKKGSEEPIHKEEEAAVKSE